MGNGMVPKIGDRGTFNLKAPWVIDTRGEFTCHAIRSFNELSKNNLNAYELFYKPKGVSEAQFKEDSAQGVVIVGLRSSTGSYIYVPSSYILGVPNGNGFPYSRRFLTIDLGALPIGLSTEPLRNDLSLLINSRFGVNPVVKEAEMPITDVVTPENHATIEAGRIGRIKDSSNTETLYREALATIGKLLEENKSMSDMLIELGVIEL